RVCCRLGGRAGWPRAEDGAQIPPSLGERNRRNPTSTMVSRRPRPQRRVRVFAAATPPRGLTAAQSGVFGGDPCADDWFTGWPEGQPASVGTPIHGVRPRANPIQHGPTRFELEIPMTLPGPDVTHRWQGRTLRDHPCDALR